MTDTIKGKENPFCPQWGHVVEITDTKPYDFFPNNKFSNPGFCWLCLHCLAFGPVKPTANMAWGSLLTPDGQQVIHLRALLKFLEDKHPRLVDDAMQELELARCECGDLCTQDEIHYGEDADLCPACVAGCIEEAKEQGRELEAKGLFRCHSCEEDFPRDMATKEIDQYGRSLCPRCKAQVRACRVCGCTDDDCSQCVEAQGHPCHWVAADLCSRCQEEGKA